MFFEMCCAYSVRASVVALIEILRGARLAGVSFGLWLASYDPESSDKINQSQDTH